MKTLRMVTISMLVATAACSSSSTTSDGGNDTVVALTGSLYPLAIGNHWVYQVTDTDGTLSTEVVSVAAQEPVGGTGTNAAITAFRVVTGAKVNDPNGDLDWEAEVDSRAVRYREVSVGESKGAEKNESSWDPPRLRVDETPAHTAAGAAWNEPTYTEVDTDIDSDGDGGTLIPDGGITTQTEDDIWTVIGVDETVTVGAQSYVALHLRRVDKVSADGIKEFWFAHGIGLVKETGTGKPTHELTSYSVAPSP
jgi:hypothetical protein